MSVNANTALRLSDEQAMLMDVARNFCREQWPVAAVRAQLESPEGFDRELWQQMVSLGWTGIALPEAYGGAGLSAGALVPVLEAMGRALLGTPLLSTVLAGYLLLRAGGETRTGQWLADIAAGTPATVAWLEGGDWGETVPTCAVDGAGTLRGRKRSVLDAAAAGLLVIPVMQGGEVALAVLRGDQLPAGARTPNTLIDLTRRAEDLVLDGLAVAGGAVLTGPAVATALRETRLLGALLVAAEATGSAAACLDTMVEYLKTRKQFGRLIGSYQALKHPCVDILNGVDSARSFIYHGATLFEEATFTRDTEIACRMAKAQAGDTLCYAGDRAVQFHGGMGFTWECDAQLYIRRAQWCQQAFGDARHHRKHLAALWLD